jgi:hypothetical protein
LRLAAMTRRERSAIVWARRNLPHEEASPMEQTLNPTVDFDPRAAEEARVHDWRTEQLYELGLPRFLAERFADQIDWHDLAALVERGCPAGLALEIVR